MGLQLEEEPSFRGVLRQLVYQDVAENREGPEETPDSQNLCHLRKENTRN